MVVKVKKKFEKKTRQVNSDKGRNYISQRRRKVRYDRSLSNQQK